MNHDSLITYNHEITSLVSFLHPLGTSWEQVRMDSLENLMRYLQEERSNFLKLLTPDSSNCRLSIHLLKDIFRSLRKYTTWWCDNNDTIQKIIDCPDSPDLAKVSLAREIAYYLEIFWLEDLLEICEPLQKEEEFEPEYLTDEERNKNSLKIKEDENKAYDIAQLTACLNGSEGPERRYDLFEILAKVLKYQKGKATAHYLRAAYDLNWLIDVPTFKLIRKYWGVECQQSAISGRYDIIKGEGFEKKLLDSYKAELTVALKNHL